METLKSLKTKKSVGRENVNSPRPANQNIRPITRPRPRVLGRFFYVGSQKIYLKGVTYGTFRPDENGDQFPDRETIARDFTTMAKYGINTVRTYTIPPSWLLDEALKTGLFVMVGIPWEQHITFLDGRDRGGKIIERSKIALQPVAAHPAILAYTIGNEIPAPIVRWHGKRRIENFLKRFYKAIKKLDPEGLVTYVNYPTTEFLNLPFLDFVAFNVFLETKDQLKSYLARIHNLSNERPLILTEIGLDSRGHGEETQAESIEWQVRTSYTSGCGGVFTFAWTDEWYRGGHDILDWDFGLTRRDRSPKQALHAVSRAFAEVPLPVEIDFPMVSVVVCCYNEEASLGGCLEGLQNMEYPNYEVIVVNDGSTDRTPQIAEAFDCKLITTENQGLSQARNTGADAAKGEIVAYIDGDAYPDPQWLHYLVHTFQTRDVQAVGGPNILPPEDGTFSECIAHSPGGPAHVLFSDTVAEHIPGCNMAFRKSCLDAVQGFDPQFRAAGDDVDICWRIMERGWRIGFHPSAIVWHHRRCTLLRYWRQQKGYGKAEALLERKWPEKYNRAGHIPWLGRIYSKGLTKTLGIVRGRIYQGTWGLAPFQALYQKEPGSLALLPLTPEWLLGTAFLGCLSLLGFFWQPLLYAVPFLALFLLLPAGQSIKSAFLAPLNPRRHPFWKRQSMRCAIAFLHYIQPAARLAGRLKNGLTIWRNRCAKPTRLRISRRQDIWSETWHPPEKWLGDLETCIQDNGAIYVRGGDFDNWDLDAFSGLFGAIRIKMTIEEHGAGKQLVRFRARPHMSKFKIGMTTASVFLTLCAGINGAWIPAAVMGIWTLGLLYKERRDSLSVMTSYAEGVATLSAISAGGTEP